MKRIIIYSLSMLAYFGLKAQASLPTSWDMGNNTAPISSPPAGWSYLNSNGGNLIYTTSAFYSSAPQAYRLDANGEYLQCQFVDKPSKVEFYIRHTGSTGSFPGEFQLKESINGTTWTTVKTYTTDMPGVMTKLTENLNSSSRYIRWELTNKPSGFNISIDDAEIFPATGGPNKEIEVYSGQSENRVIKGGTEFMGDTNNYKFTIVNKSTTQNLKIDSVILSGTNKTHFILNGLPTSVGFGTNNKETFTISKDTLGIDGSKMAILTIYSDDQEGNASYNFNLSAIKGDKATEPIGAPNNLAFTMNMPWRLKFKWSAANDAQNYLVLINNSDVSDAPQDNVTYDRGAYIGTSRIVHVGPVSEIEINKIEANTNYYVKVFPFNGINGFENYTSVGYSINTITGGLNPGAYYSGVSNTQTTFVQDLRRKINPHFQVYYSNYAPFIVDNFEAYDTTEGRLVLTGYYSWYKHIYTAPLIWNVMSREHAYPYSYMGESSKDSANYSDLHILLPVNQNQANAIRSNFPLGEVVNPTFTFMGGKVGTDKNGTTVYEPMNSTKGIVARSNFYACAAYHTNSKKFTLPTSNQFLGQLQDQWLLKKWHQQYPPSNREIARHEYIASVQNNRNPFIDNPAWACNINFADMTFLIDGNCDSLRINSSLNVKNIYANIYPNPSKGSLIIEAGAFKTSSLEVSVYDFTERLVWKGNLINKKTNLDLNLSAGSYLLVIKGDKEISAQKVIIE